MNSVYLGMAEFFRLEKVR